MKSKSSGKLAVSEGIIAVKRQVIKPSTEILVPDSEKTAGKVIELAATFKVATVTSVPDLIINVSESIAVFDYVNVAGLDTPLFLRWAAKESKIRQIYERNGCDPEPFLALLSRLPPTQIEDEIDYIIELDERCSRQPDRKFLYQFVASTRPSSIIATRGYYLLSDKSGAEKQSKRHKNIRNRLLASLVTWLYEQTGDSLETCCAEVDMSAQTFYDYYNEPGLLFDKYAVIEFTQLTLMELLEIVKSDGLTKLLTKYDFSRF